ncbi:MAG TPA: cupin domain-containing protein [Bacteroidales bacterium]|nr:cupin domain-containing protein [Bacteroidales bacterium]
METNPFISSEPFSFKDSVQYSDGAIVSKRVLEKPAGNVSLFAFDAGQRINEHSAPFDALVQVVEGEATVIINKEAYSLAEGQSIIMPANVPHALEAPKRFKMLLTMIKGQ